MTWGNQAKLWMPCVWKYTLWSRPYDNSMICGWWIVAPITSQTCLMKFSVCHQFVNSHDGCTLLGLALASQTDLSAKITLWAKLCSRTIMDCTPVSNARPPLLGRRLTRHETKLTMPTPTCTILTSSFKSAVKMLMDCLRFSSPCTFRTLDNNGLNTSFKHFVCSYV